MLTVECCRNFLFLLCFLILSTFFFFFNDTATTEIYTLSLHDALPICSRWSPRGLRGSSPRRGDSARSEEHTSELQSLRHIVCRLLLEKKKTNVTESLEADGSEHFSVEIMDCRMQ